MRNALGEAYKRSGYDGYLLAQAQFALAKTPELGRNPAYAAHCYALLNDEARALTALEVAYKQHNTGVLFLRTAPELDSIRSSPPRPSPSHRVPSIVKRQQLNHFKH